jgi:hypothetical protein
MTMARIHRPEQPKDAQAAEGGDERNAHGGGTDTETAGQDERLEQDAQSAQTRPGGSAPGGQEPGRDRDPEHGSQGLSGAQGGGGRAERGMSQDPDQRRRTSGSGPT